MKKLLIISLTILPLACSDGATAACRSQTIKHRFDVSQGYPKGRPNYIVDHVCALFCGGLDSPKNMQYQTFIESYAKDRWETTPAGCKKTCNLSNSLPTRTVFNCK